MHTGLKQAHKKDGLDGQLESILSKLESHLGTRQEIMKAQIELVGELEQLEQNQAILREKIQVNEEGNIGDGGMVKTTV